MKSAVYAGTFDPITLGHVDIIRRALCIFDEVIVGVSTHYDKKTLFSLEERREMVEESLRGLENVEVKVFGGLLIDFAKKNGCSTIVKGLRAVSDFEMEFQQALTNRMLDQSVETIFIMTSQEHVFLSSSLVKEIAKNNGPIRKFVPEVVRKKLMEKNIKLG